MIPGVPTDYAPLLTTLKLSLLLTASTEFQQLTWDQGPVTVPPVEPSCCYSTGARGTGHRSP